MVRYQYPSAFITREVYHYIGSIPSGRWVPEFTYHHDPFGTTGFIAALAKCHAFGPTGSINTPVRGYRFGTFC